MTTIRVTSRNAAGTVVPLLNIFLPELTTGGLADGDYLLGATRAGNTFTVGWVPAP